MTVQEKKELSIKMGMSILLGKNVFNITELLDKDVINGFQALRAIGDDESKRRKQRK